MSFDYIRKEAQKQRKPTMDSDGKGYTTAPDPPKPKRPLLDAVKCCNVFHWCSLDKESRSEAKALYAVLEVAKEYIISGRPNPSIFLKLCKAIDDYDKSHEE